MKVGNLVFKRVPGLNKCLESCWEGPYKILKLIHPVNCQIRDVEKKSKPTVVHVSQLKLVSDASVFRVVNVVDDPLEIPDVQPSLDKVVSLTLEQSELLQSTIDSFPSVFSDKPDLTSVASHSIQLTSSTPVWTPPYTVPLVYQEVFCADIPNLLEFRIYPTFFLCLVKLTFTRENEGWRNPCSC